METGVEEIGRFVIGDEGYRLFYGSAASDDTAGRTATDRKPVFPRRESPEAASHEAKACATLIRRPRVIRAERRDPEGPALRTGSPLAARSVGVAAGARVLVHDGPGPIGAHIYYPDALIRRLEEHPPTQGLGERNIDEFVTFVEELDHFLLIAERARLRRPVSLLELEIHANVTKYLVCALFISAAGGGSSRVPLRAGERLWLLWHLFEKAWFDEVDPLVQVRYHEASRFAHRFLGRLDAQPSAAARLDLLRAFHNSTHQDKLASLG